MKNKEFLNSVNINADSNFPYLVLDVVNERSYPRNPGFLVMHWHEDLQFIYVLQGEIVIETLESSTTVCRREGAFINKEIVHRIRQCGSCHYKSFIFPVSFLTFYPNSPAHGLVERITENPNLPICHLSGVEDWQEDCLSQLRELSRLEQAKNEFYPYEVLTRLAALWLTMQKNIELPQPKDVSAAAKRMRIFLAYIREHYAEDITLAQLAQSANVSKAECLRCFHQTMDTTPYKYLMEYRLSRAMELLIKTDKPIGEIAAAVGFRQASHFGKCFRERTGLSPRDYRKGECAENQAMKE